MKYQLVNLGREHFTGTVEAKSERELETEVRKHLMSNNVDIEWDDAHSATVYVGGFRAVGAVVRLHEA